MLILTRMPQQTLCVYPKDKLGQEEHLIEIVILGFHGARQVRMGIEAPKYIEVHRREIYENILLESQQEVK